MLPKSGLYLLFIILLVLAVLTGYLFNWINDTFFHYSSGNNDLDSFSEPIKFLLIVVIAPLVETLFFQHLPYQVLTKLKIRNKLLLILTLSLIFGLFHLYFWLYAIMAFCGGILMNTLYIFSRHYSKYYFLIVVAYHSLYNLYGYLFVV
ncbi:CPBP family glutamic-type intramembrane protease [Chryseosolibacter indicus]|uniref:CPBP family intramembrane metalloprotease n=1 Tax=Chryseosolibacter indicus TaxID=2782351 RepID=A0ABS5VV48_9BACT|nr:CPBP family intramembrane metalloprotease [Chryseosolibacter indicus]